MFIAVTLPQRVGVAGLGGVGGVVGAGDIKYNVSPMLSMLPIDVVSGKFISTAVGAAESTLLLAAIPFNERRTYSSVAAGVAPEFLIKANHDPSFFSNHE